MAESRPSTAETATATHKHKSFLSRKKSSTDLDDNIDEKGGNITTTEVIVPDESPVSFTQLFRSVEFLGAFVDSMITSGPDTPQNLSSL